MGRRTFDSPIPRHAAPAPPPAPSPAASAPPPATPAPPPVQAEAQPPVQGPDQRRDYSDPCCRLFNVGHTVYKGHYLPSLEEYVLHGYPAAGYESFIAREKAWLDRPSSSEPEPAP